MCPTGWYVSDFNVRTEGMQLTGDDTALNGLRLRCKNPANLFQTTDIMVFPGNWGSWKGWHPINPYNFMWAAVVRSQASQGSGDDTAMNGLAGLMIP